MLASPVVCCTFRTEGVLGGEVLVTNLCLVHARQMLSLLLSYTLRPWFFFF